MQKKLLSVQLAIKTPKVLHLLTEIINNFNGFSLQEDDDAARVDILVLEIGSDPESEFETIKSLLQENVVGHLFLTSSVTTTDVLLPALRAGAKEFFPQPIDTEEVKGAFQKILTESLLHNQDGSEGPHDTGKIFSVLGAKGGVGTTTFAVNFATSLQALDKSKLVALIDMNRLVGEVPLFLDLETDTNWEEIAKNLSRLDAAYLQSAMVQHSSGVYVMPAPGKLDIEAKFTADFLFQLLRAMRNFFDYIIVDNGMYFDDTSFKIFKESEKVYLVSILSLPCVINVKKLKESLQSHGVVSNGKLRIIANRFEKKSQLSLAEANKITGTEIAMTIPNNYSLSMSAVNNGQTIAQVSKNSNLAKEYTKIAESVNKISSKESGGLFNWFK
ncbi:MAG: P-loop NTPase [Thermodesulfobacteriota bacterium]|nr:P-loop NTPase [Thermodesulfobacteriota bacterium]